jgi:Holliday junction resolvase-like predicted endonuclease
MGRTEAQRRGRWAEQRAERLLRQAGWRPLARRWRCRWGELDLLLHKGPDRLLLGEHLLKALKSVQQTVLRCLHGKKNAGRTRAIAEHVPASAS